MMFSLIREQGLETLEVNKELGFIRLYNKRGTGNTIDCIYKFNVDRLLLEQSTIDPRNYPEMKEDNKKSKW